MKKSPLVYWLVFAIWSLVAGFLIWQLVVLVQDSLGRGGALWQKIIYVFVMCCNCLIFLYFWLNSLKDLMFSLVYIFKRKKIFAEYKKYDKFCEDRTKRVLLLYCTYNDLNENALLECAKQNYENFEVVILDDSTKQEYKDKIDEIANEHNFTVVRRENRVGFKAGNINNYLQNKHDYDYFVVLDSDEIIPPNFILNALTYFEMEESVGAVQGKHIATQGTNAFQELLGMSINSNGEISQIMKNFYGANSLLGHGMIISRVAYEKVGGFPHVVAEDISFSLQLNAQGYRILWAPNIVCQEEFPVNYIALKKRQCKWTQGNLEYMKNFSKEIDKCGLTWFEKLDLKLSHYSLPVVPVLSLFLVINAIILGWMNFFNSSYGIAFMVIMGIFLLSPLIPDLFAHHGTKKFWLILPYFALNIVTYAAMAPMMLATIVLGAFGKKAKFIITPKEEGRITFGENIRNTIDSVVFGLIIMIITYFAYGSIWITAFLSICCVLAPVVVVLANVKVKPKSNEFVVIKGNSTELATQENDTLENNQKIEKQG